LIELDGGYTNLAVDKCTGTMACGLASRGADQERPKMAVGWRSKTSREEWRSAMATF
jgi:predicted lipoprotein